MQPIEFEDGKYYGVKKPYYRSNYPEHKKLELINGTTTTAQATSQLPQRSELPSFSHDAAICASLVDTSTQPRYGRSVMASFGISLRDGTQSPAVT